MDKMRATCNKYVKPCSKQRNIGLLLITQKQSFQSSFSFLVINQTWRHVNITASVFSETAPTKTNNELQAWQPVIHVYVYKLRTTFFTILPRQKTLIKCLARRWKRKCKRGEAKTLEQEAILKQENSLLAAYRRHTTGCQWENYDRGKKAVPRCSTWEKWIIFPKNYSFVLRPSFEWMYLRLTYYENLHK